MILELQANSKLNQGYVPDWIRLEIYDEDTRLFYELTMDITGETDYAPTTLRTHTKGWLTPWTYQNGDEFIELEDAPKNQIAKYNQLFEELIQKADTIVIGVYPVDDTDDSIEDILTDGIGCYINSNGLYIKFEFECELNL